MAWLSHDRRVIRLGIGEDWPRSDLLLTSLMVIAFLTIATGAAGAQSAPNAKLTVSPNPAHPDRSVLLDGRNSTAEEKIIGCEFDVDGDGQYERQDDDCVVEHTYPEVGDYTVRLRIYTTTEREDTDEVVLSVVKNNPPEPVITVDPVTPRPNETISLSGTESTDPDGQIARYIWTLPAESRNGETVTTSFTDPGEYEIALTVTDDDSASATAQTVITVEPNKPPSAVLSVSPESIRVGKVITFDAKESTDPESRITMYRWDFDGDGELDATTETASIEYEPTEPGEYSVTVTVVDDRGATDQTSASYDVSERRTETQVPTTVRRVRQTSPITDQTTDVTTTVGTERMPAVGNDSPADGNAIPVSPIQIAGALVVLLGAIVGVGLRRRGIIHKTTDILRDLLTRGDIRKRIAQTLSRTTIKNVVKRSVRRFSDVIDAAGDTIGEAMERAGQAIKRGSSTLAAWLRRLGS